MLGIIIYSICGLEIDVDHIYTIFYAQKRLENKIYKKNKFNKLMTD